MNDRKAWLAKRRAGIGGSDAAAILGYSPWKSAMQVWMEKMGLEEPERSEQEQFQLDLGTDLEPVIAKLYERQTKSQLYQPVLTPMVNPRHDFMLGSPDRLVLGELRGVELKTENRYIDEFGEPGTDEVPYHYLIQCAHYMAVLDYPVWDVALLKSGASFAVYHIERDLELETEMIESLGEWWNEHIVKKIPPDLDGSDAWRVYLKQRYPRDILPIKTEGELNARTLTVINNLRTIRQILSEYGELEQHCENEIKAVIGEHEGIVGDFGKVTWKKSRDGTHTDWESVALDLAARLGWKTAGGPFLDAIALHSVDRPGSRRFLFTPKKGWKFDGIGIEAGNSAEAGSIEPGDGQHRLGSASESADRSALPDGGTPSERP